MNVETRCSQSLEVGLMKDKFLKGANDNVIFSTSRCNNRCIMCCQPPSIEDDSEELFQQNIELIVESDCDNDYVCITGGEPTLIEEKLFDYVRHIRERMPEAAIHILTNGRRFADFDYLCQFKKNVEPEKLVLGIPLHSDNYLDHDLIAGHKGAFLETAKGLTNLGLLSYEIELRVIILKQNYKRLSKIAEFITMNFPFVSQVAFMGLEITGFADKNYEWIWAEPSDYVDELIKAINILNKTRIVPLIFNHPLCLLPPELWDYACQSISEWKRTYLPLCDCCTQKEKCSGLFATSKRYSDNIRAIE